MYPIGTATRRNPNYGRLQLSSIQQSRAIRGCPSGWFIVLVGFPAPSLILSLPILKCGPLTRPIVWQDWSEGKTATGAIQTHVVRGDEGEVFAIAQGNGYQYRRYSYIPSMGSHTMRGDWIPWPNCTSTGLQPTRDAKLAILCGHMALLREAMTPGIFYSLAHRIYPSWIARRILRAWQAHFGRNSRQTAHPIMANKAGPEEVPRRSLPIQETSPRI